MIGGCLYVIGGCLYVIGVWLVRGVVGGKPLQEPDKRTPSVSSSKNKNMEILQIWSLLCQYSLRVLLRMFQTQQFVRRQIG